MSGLGYSNAKSVRISHIELSETKSKNPEINFQGSGKFFPFDSMVQNYIVNVKEFDGYTFVGIDIFLHKGIHEW